MRKRSIFTIFLLAAVISVIVVNIRRYDTNYSFISNPHSKDREF